MGKEEGIIWSHVENIMENLTTLPNTYSNPGQCFVAREGERQVRQKRKAGEAALPKTLIHQLRDLAFLVTEGFPL